MKNPTTKNSKLDSKLVSMHVAILRNEISNIYLFFNINFEIKILYGILCCWIFLNFELIIPKIE
jgi:hypothetical protein